MGAPVLVQYLRQQSEPQPDVKTCASVTKRTTITPPRYNSINNLLKPGVLPLCNFTKTLGGLRGCKQLSSSSSWWFLIGWMDESQVRERLRQLLPQLDLDTATQRTIQERLEDEMGISLEQYKPLLKAEIDAFLVADCDDYKDVEESKEDHPSLPDSSPPAKRRKSNDHGAGLEVIGQETERSSSEELPPGFHICRPISSSSKRFAGVRSYKNATLVDVREFYRNEQKGQLAPGQKGLSMSVPQWRSLVAKQNDITDAINRGDDSFYVELGSNRRAAVSSLGGKIMVQLREYYEKNGSMLPGKRGIALPPDQWNALCTAVPCFNNHVPQSGPIESTTQALRPGREEEGGEPTLCSVTISNDPVRKVQVTRWKGRLVVDIREFYKRSTDGRLAHSKKGVSLTEDQFKVLQNAADSVTQAFEREDTSFQVGLSDMRKLTINKYRGSLYVDLREYYSTKQGGDLAPTQRGISLTGEQWQKVVEALPDLEMALSGASKISQS